MSSEEVPVMSIAVPYPAVPHMAANLAQIIVIVMA
jgi:hypothetical protein